jgi:hypothetical protein
MLNQVVKQEARRPEREVRNGRVDSAPISQTARRSIENRKSKIQNSKRLPVFQISRRFVLLAVCLPASISVDHFLMFGALKKKLLAAIKAAAMERPCPNCGQKFKPFADRELTSWSDLKQPCTCPKCGHSSTFEELAQSAVDQKVNPKGPFARPLESCIERRQPASHELAFYIPPHGRWGIWLFGAFLWNLISWTIFLGFLGRPEFPPLAVVMASLFVIIGLGLIFVALRHRYGSTLVELTPETIRLRRGLFGIRRDYEVRTSEVHHISKTVFYTQSYLPVYGIEIKTSRRRLRFGSSLTEDEKNWLRWEIQEFVRAHSRQTAIDPAVQSLIRT